MALTRIVYEYSGQPTYAVNFSLGYLDPAHVTCRVNEEVDGAGEPVFRTINFLSEGVVNSISGSLTNGDLIVFERTVPSNVLQHDYQDGALLIEDNLDESFKQVLMLVQEVLDGRLAELTVDLDAGGNQIKNVGAGTDSNDAVTFQQLNDATGDIPASALEAEKAKSVAVAAAAVAIDSKEAAEAAAAALVQNKWDATTAPTATDDASEGYSEGSRWIKVSGTREAWICVDSTDGAAQWLNTTLETSELGSAAFVNSNTFATAAQGSLADTAVQPADVISATKAGAYLGQYSRLQYSRSWSTGASATTSGNTPRGRPHNAIVHDDLGIVLLDNIHYDNLNGAGWDIGETVTGGTSGATGVIRANTGASAYGGLHIESLNGVFVDNETLSGSTSATTALVRLTEAELKDASKGTYLPDAFILGAGDYELDSVQSVGVINTCFLQLEDIVNDTPLVTSMTTYEPGYSSKAIKGNFSLSEDTVLSIRQYSQSGDASWAFGYGSYAFTGNVPTLQIFGDTYIRKVS